MEESRTSTRLLIVSAVVLIVVLISGPLGYRFGFIPLMPSFASVLVAVLGGAITAVASLVMVLFAIRDRRTQDRNGLLVSLLLGIVPVLILLPYLTASVPPIHDITTDTDDPPAFDAVVALRVDAMNSLDYGSAALPADELARLQTSAYPAVKPLMSTLAPADAIARSESVLRDMGLEIVSTDTAAGRVEATATTFWFGFKDDVVVRVTAADGGSRIDVRSVSRVGQSDIGANAARIEAFLSRF
jgi:uncharacterized protein (DUF1499 family)